MLKSFLFWIHGLGATAISGAAHSVAGMAIKPDAFNLGSQLRSTLALAVASGVISAALYLATSPLPKLPTTPTTEEKQS